MNNCNISDDIDARTTGATGATGTSSSPRRSTAGGTTGSEETETHTPLHGREAPLPLPPSLRSSLIGLPIDSADSSLCGNDPTGMSGRRSSRLDMDDSDTLRSKPQQQQSQQTLEERLEELELKLSVLSRLLQQQQRQPPPPAQLPLSTPPETDSATTNHGSSSDDESCDRIHNRRHKTTFAPYLESPALTFSKAIHHPPNRSHDDQNHHQHHQHQNDGECHSPILMPQNHSTSIVPHLESPAMLFSESKDSRRQQQRLFDLTPTVEFHESDRSKNDANEQRETATRHNSKNRNLSLLLLFDGNQMEYDKECHSFAPQLSSMTMEERQWLRPQLRQYLQQQPKQQEQQQQQQIPNHQSHSQQKITHQDDGNDEMTQNDVSVFEQVDEETRMLSVVEGRHMPTPHQAGSAGTGRSKSKRIGDDADDDNDEKLGSENDGGISVICNNSETNLPPHQQQQQRRTRSQSITDDVNLLRKKVRTKWLEYLNSVQESAPDVDVQMEEFIKVPAAVESIMSFGFFICVDSYLYMFTVLPIRFVWSCLLLLIKLLVGPGKQAQNPQFQFHRRHLYQLIQVFILFVIYQYVLVPISIGKLYHWIRGQAMIKLYVIIAMVEIFDRLFSSLGQDCLDSMYWNTVSRPRSKRFLVSVLVVLVYAAFHTLILFVHVATLNVAMNSADQALLTLLISGNFAEIKSTVFKKYNKAALFKITAQDVCERFKLGLFLSLVLLLNICQGMDQAQFLSYMQICGLVWCTEIIADWIKHAFITKFNFLPARVYPEYALLLAGDVTGIGHEGMSLDHSHGVVKRIGFAQIPLLCVMFRLLKEAAKYARYHHQTLHTNNPIYLRLLLAPFSASSPQRQVIMYFCVWAVLLILKLVLGRLLQDISLKKLYAAPEYSQLTPIYTPASKSAKKKMQ